jgi:hypothetical protein
MAKEEWERQIVENVLKRIVEIHDDNSSDGMYDLRIGAADSPDIAIECIRAVEKAYMETRNQPMLLNTSIPGIWVVNITINAPIKRLQKEIDALLRELQSLGCTNLKTGLRLKHENEALDKRLTSLGIRSILFSLPSEVGQVYLLMPMKVYSANEKGDALPAWIGKFLRDDACQDVLCKLQRSGAVERQVFIVTGFHGLPEDVDAYLRGDLNRVPIIAPDLPPPVTGVWIIEEFSTRGLYWGGMNWHLFDAPSRPSLD